MKEQLIQVQKAYPLCEVEVWAFDEHRLGLKPVKRRVWVREGLLPKADVWHRFEWLYVYGFVHPQSGRTEWFLMPSVNIESVNLVLKDFAQAVGAGQNKRVLLLLDGAGYHSEPKLTLPDGLHLVKLPPYSPELQPAERLWPLLDEPLVNRTFNNLDSLQDVLSLRCCTLSSMPQLIRGHTLFHWWPQRESIHETL